MKHASELTCTRGTDQDCSELLRWRLGTSDRFLCLSFERVDLLVELRDERLEVLEFVLDGHGECDGESKRGESAGGPTGRKSMLDVSVRPPRAGDRIPASPAVFRRSLYPAGAGSAR